MSDDPQHLSSGAMAPQPTAAPIAASAREINFARHPRAHPRGILRIFRTNAGHLSNKLMARGSPEAIIPALKFQVSGADPRGDLPNTREPGRDSTLRLASNFHASGTEKNGDHCALLI